MQSEVSYPADIKMRDYFAAIMMPKVYGFLVMKQPEDIARISYQIADAMMKESKNDK